MYKYLGPKRSLGFTLIEVIVVAGIVAILASVAGINAVESNQRGRDAKRQSDLRSLQSAIELYKNKNGRYPEGCLGADKWSGQIGTDYTCADGTNNYIQGLAPEFISVLPIDKKLNGTNSGYVYRTNTSGTVYKIMAMRTVESESVDYNNPLKSCDIRPDSSGGIQNTGANGVDTGGWCETATIEAKEPSGSPATSVDNIAHCRRTLDSGDGRFEISYGLWGGFETVLGGSNQASKLRGTTRVICK